MREPRRRETRVPSLARRFERVYVPEVCPLRSALPRLALSRLSVGSRLSRTSRARVSRESRACAMCAVFYGSETSVYVTLS